MKKHKDLLYTFLGITVLAAIIYGINRTKQPEPVKLDFTEQPQTEAHKLVGEILSDTEAFSEAEDASLNQVLQPPSSASIPLPVAGAPLPVVWESKSAPTLDEAELSPSLQRSLAASASLRAETYTNPISDLNLKRVEDLRAIRKSRHESE